MNSGYIINGNNSGYVVYDGAGIAANCTQVAKQQWSYNLGILMSGAAYMYNYTSISGSSSKSSSSNSSTGGQVADAAYWGQELDNLVGGMEFFFKDGIMYEHQCEDSATCNNDQRSFKSIFSRCLAITARLAPDHASNIMDYLSKSAEAAAKTCSGGTDGITCGQKWTVDGWDTLYGLGEQLSALEVMQSTLILETDVAPAPLSNSTGGTSQGNTNAGLDTKDATNVNEITVKEKDKAGAAVITAVVLSILMAMCVWMLI
ncbi:unnamed protein product [Ambrosiozyma monospora]|uniref:mannan endo-1,6-alpha-mannosidase n=1 Tax=Ambrosiozyma monospora TaxID=43982 RepID=A0A9W6Z1G9_AMBMO|nr:unnamed protein product [Ambrosiozyma monospora]